ncbi:MAG: type IX secretion system sortase PorU [Bacteroidetes bacterium]|nr:type IX secretion system sortase PorU [Bacteroidota bacterium]
MAANLFYKKTGLLVLFCAQIIFSFSQSIFNQPFSVSLNWKATNNNISFNNAAYSSEYDYLPTFVWSHTIGTTKNFDVKLSNEVYSPLENFSLNDNQKNLIKNSIVLNKEIGSARHENIASITIFPFRNNNGQIEVLKSFDFTLVPTTTENAQRFGLNENSQRVYAPNSILRSGNWYKFGVTKAGVYKLDYKFLKTLGMNVDGISPQNIRIFGHRAGMLPELAGADREDDPLEIPIKVVTANSSQFQANDYILAYLPGPEKWTYQPATQTFKATKHYYSDTKNFFITADVGSGARIPSINSTALPENTTISTYDDYGFIEDDISNIALSGKQFVGDEFGGITDKSYAFNFPNLNSSQPVKVLISLVATSKYAGSTFTVTSDGGNNSNSIFIPNVSIIAGIENYAEKAERLLTLNNLSPQFNIQLNYNRNGDFSTKGWLDYLQINAMSTLQYNGQPLYFRSKASIGAGNVSKFIIQNMNSNVEIWDVTNPFEIQKINYQLSGNTASFTLATDTLKEFVAVENSDLIPTAFGALSNQNIHALEQQDMLIFTRSALLSQANELAQFHRDKQGLRVAVLELNQVYNEFSSGTNDPTAIRNCIKMFYDRANGDVTQMPKYVLIFGDGTYDNKNLGDYLMPTYESYKTYEALETFVSDDYFGLLDDNEGADITNTATEKLDVSVGRIPADDISKAQNAVNKIKQYASKEAYGDWRNQGTFIADDEDYNIHIQDADEIATNVSTAQNKINIDKIYLDAFKQQIASGNESYPDVTDAINKKMFSGTLFINYVGHGGPLGLAKERILDYEDINQWSNSTKLPVFITASCEFAPFDLTNQYTAGERVLFQSNGGGIALVTTTRIVYSNRNKVMNQNFMTQFVNAYSNKDLKLGDVLRIAKNNTNTGDGNRKFSLLGDPAIELAIPKYNVVATKLNSVPISSPHDTLKALSKITIEGEVRDLSNSLMSDFNGITAINIYDKTKNVNTLQNDPQSLAFSFSLQKNIIYKGKTQTTNGKFTTTFLVPKDIDYTYGTGKISLYSYSDTTDAAGYSNDIIVGGASDTFPTDNKGPEIDVFMNDDKFVFGGITDESPKLFCKFYDENGINTSGNGLGHDITAIIDNDTKNFYTLNDFYETEVDDISNGKLLYPFSKLSKGRHTLEVKAWDVLNNSGVGYTEFLVEENAKLALSHVLNYPNPFTTYTRFMFEHNRPGASLDLKIEIFSVSGKVIKTITRNINTSGYRVDDITWDGLDDFGDKIGNGIYIYRITLKDDSGKKVSQYQKLVVLN